MTRKMFFGISFGVLCFLSIACFVVLRQKTTTRAPNIVLITLDALRADHLGCYGYSRDTSPNIDGLARRGATFVNVVAPSSHTAPSNASLITSTNPNVHGIKDWGYQFGPKTPKTLPVVLKEHGFSTAFISDQSGLTLIKGFEKGFDTFTAIRLLTPGPHPERVSDITDWAITWLSGNKRKRFFLWLYYFSPHGPYIPPSPYAEMFGHDFLDSAVRTAPISGDYFPQNPVGAIPRYLAIDGILDVNYYVSQYDGEIRRVDDGIGRLLKELKREGLDGNTIIIVNADHGEAMGEHNRFFCHANSLYDELVRVPLIVRWDERIPSGIKIDKQVRTIDLMPTILEAAGIKNGSNMRGQSFLPLLLGKTTAFPPIAYSEWADFISLRTRKWKLIQDRRNLRYELYDLEKDPGEREDLVEKETAAFNLLKPELDKYLFETETENKPVKSSLEPEAREMLRSLGYAQ